MTGEAESNGIAAQINWVLDEMTENAARPLHATEIFQIFAYTAIRRNQFDEKARTLLAWALFQPEYSGILEQGIKKRLNSDILYHKNNNLIVAILRYLQNGKVTVYDFYDAAFAQLKAIIAVYKTPTFTVFKEQKQILEIKDGEEQKPPEPIPNNSSGFFAAIGSFFSAIFSGIKKVFCWIFKSQATRYKKQLLKKLKNSAGETEQDEVKFAREVMNIVNEEPNAIDNFQTQAWFKGPARTRIRAKEAILRQKYHELLNRPQA